MEVKVGFIRVLQETEDIYIDPGESQSVSFSPKVNRLKTQEKLKHFSFSLKAGKTDVSQLKAVR